MLIFYADIQGLDEGRALCRGRSRAPGSAFAYSLLKYALEVWKGATELPAVAADSRGKPYFPEQPDWQFSLSHTRGFVLAAVSEKPVGADVQLRDGRGERLAGRLMSEREREQFDFYELWSLRESLYKLTGEGSLRTLRFERRGGLIVPPCEGAQCRTYGDIPGCSAAAASLGEPLPERLIRVDGAKICT